MNAIPGKPKKRGRPRKEKEINNFFIGGVPDLDILSKNIAAQIGIRPGPLTDKLAHAGSSFIPLSNLQKNGPLKRRGKGNRSKINLAVLLRDCAVVFETQTGQSAVSALRQIGGWEEEENAAKSQVLIYTKAVLAALDIKHTQSLRHQARRAIELF